jgi:hypothetical protein
MLPVVGRSPHCMGLGSDEVGRTIYPGAIESLQPSLPKHKR